MSYRNNQPVGGRRSTGSMNCPTTSTPFMFGGSYSGGNQNNGGSFYSASATTFGNHPSANGVRDCLFWPASLPAGRNNGSNYASASPQMYNYNSYTQRPTATRQTVVAPANSCMYPQPKAFIQYPGMGGGESKMQPIPIACRLGPSGSPMAPLAASEPFTIKVTAPAPSSDGKPIAIKIDPSQFMGMATMKTYSSGRN